MDLECFSDDARELLYLILESFREQMAPDMPAERWRAASLRLMRRGLLVIHYDGHGFTPKLTAPEAVLRDLLGPETMQ